MQFQVDTEQVKALDAGEEIVVLVEMEPQLDGDGWIYMGHRTKGHSWERFTYDGLQMEWRDCPVAVGETVAVTEVWAHYQPLQGLMRCDGAWVKEWTDGSAAYKADGFDTIEELKDHLLSMGDFFDVVVRDDTWQLPESMPDWAIRFRPIVRHVAHRESKGVHYWEVRLSK